MGTVGEGLRAILAGAAGVAAIIGAAPNTRFYPVQLPQEPTLPAASYQIVSEDRPHSSQQGPLKLVAARVQVDTWALTQSDAYALAEEIRKVLDGYVGTSAGVVFQNIVLDATREFFETEPDEYRVSRDYRVWFVEDIG